MDKSIIKNLLDIGIKREIKAVKEKKELAKAFGTDVHIEGVDDDALRFEIENRYTEE